MNQYTLLVDMDGTLVDTGPIGLEVFERHLHAYGLSHNKNILKEITKRNITDILKEIFAANNKPYNHKLFEMLRADYRQGVKHAQVLPHAREFLAEMQQKAQLILATMSNDMIANIITKERDLQKYFTHIITRDTFPLHDKQDMYRNIIETYKLNPKMCIVIEDSHHGIESATALGLYTIGVRSYFQDIQADVVVKDLKEAAAIINKRMKQEKK